MIRLTDLRFAYPGGGFALNVPDLAIARGERLAFHGPSGSGKTTLLHLLAGLMPPDAGRIEIDGTDIAALPDRARRAYRAARIGFVFQNFALLDHLSARENILYPCRIGAGLRLTRAVRARAQALAEACGIADKLDRKPASLSGGEQQRVALCRALVTGPGLVLADEATGNLDPATRDLILDLLFDRVREAGATLITVTHDHAILPRFDRAVDFADLTRAAP